MQREVEAITAELCEVANHLVRMDSADKEHLKARFLVLMGEKKRAEKASARHQIYFIHAPTAALVKIGTTTSLKRRFASLQLSSPVPLVLLKSISGGRQEEAILHYRWGHLRCHGEWFMAKDELMAMIDGAL